MREEQFLIQHFKRFYGEHAVGVPAVEQREFGVGSFGKKISKRHLCFASNSALNSYLRERCPLFISYSVAYYRFPGRTPMKAKGFLGADIVYEFDADDLKTECKQRHDSWLCPECGEQGKGVLRNCPKCGALVNAEQWFCSECLNATKKQVLRLLDFVENDFSLQGSISVNFSGNAGYHVHLRSESVKRLSQEARVELLDYLTANNFDLAKHGFVDSGGRFSCPLPDKAVGWSKRLLDSLVEILETADSERVAAFGGITNANAKELLENKELVLRLMHKNGVLFSPWSRKSKGKRFWESLLQHLVASNALAIDRQTSVDISKIIRVPDTLHGGSGLVAKTVPLDSLKAFEPLCDAVVFHSLDVESVKLFINKSPKFYLGGSSFGPFEAEEAELPLHAALYLVARKAATLR